MLLAACVAHCSGVASPCGDAACPADAPPADAAFDAPATPDGDTDAGVLGAPCTADQNCASGVCLSIGRCSTACTMRADCPGGSNWMCAGVPSRGTICVCAPTGAAEVACNGVDEDCDGVTDPHQATCDGACTDLWSSNTNCGGCGTLCAGASVCVAGACACPATRPTVCGTMCVDTQTDPAHCGACATACPSGPHATARCAAGACAPACEAGWGDCDHDPATGCELDVRADAANCGACSHACAFAHAGATCSTGTCVMGACDPGYSDCNGSSLDGCEAATASDAANCGACGHACAAPNATVACTAGACALTACTMGHGDCDRAASTGCEIDLRSDPLNCGACGGACPGASAPGTVASCASGACGFACAAGRADCNANMGDGCETDVTTTAHCGACGVACLPGQSCVAGACACPSGATVCGGACHDTQSDAANCGSCGHACPAGQFCVAGACGAARFSGATGAAWETVDATGTPGMWVGFTDYVPAGGTGFYASGRTSLARFDVVTATWMALAPPYSDLNMAGYLLGTAWVGTHLYLVASNSVFRTDVPTSTWSNVASGVAPTTNTQLAHDDAGHIYFVTTDDRIATFDTATNAVTYQAFGMSAPVALPRIAWDGTTRRLYVAPNGNTADFYAFDPTTGAIQTLASMPVTRFDPAFCSDRSGHIYAPEANIGTNVWQYRAATNTWVAIPPLPFNHNANGACVVTDGGYLYMTDDGTRLARIRLL